MASSNIGMIQPFMFEPKNDYVAKEEQLKAEHVSAIRSKAKQLTLISP